MNGAPLVVLVFSRILSPTWCIVVLFARQRAPPCRWNRVWSFDPRWPDMTWDHWPLTRPELKVFVPVTWPDLKTLDPWPGYLWPLTRPDLKSPTLDLIWRGDLWPDHPNRPGSWTSSETLKPCRFYVGILNNLFRRKRFNYGISAENAPTCLPGLRLGGCPCTFHWGPHTAPCLPNMWP